MQRVRQGSASTDSRLFLKLDPNRIFTEFIENVLIPSHFPESGGERIKIERRLQRTTGGIPKEETDFPTQQREDRNHHTNGRISQGNPPISETIHLWSFNFYTQCSGRNALLTNEG
ncbi:hypothetical protein DPEC_G00063730 [Dallia pectoralis]|uniref:Uncharacterized protein n=1 Tax=Dallia pectoralis TaxID=75939 RepID=A0ACC2H7M5_DALPE|nr:hypothetical protein DPEC_G00063730 [Dallia pectoralis]